MKLTFQIVITDVSGSSRTEELMSLQRSGDALNDIGLSVSESKQLLGAVQKSLVQQQADEYIHQNIQCPHCLTNRRIKGQQKIQYRTLFGVIPVSGLRVYRCRCEESATKTVSLLSDWAGDHTHPALKYIETRWASLISYEMTARLLKDVLPVGYSLNASTVRNHLCRVAQRLDSEAESHSGFISGCPRDWGNLPKPGKPLVVVLMAVMSAIGMTRNVILKLLPVNHFQSEHRSTHVALVLSRRATVIRNVGSWHTFLLRECRLTSRYSFYPTARII